MGKFSRLGNQLYTGRKSYDFVNRRALWYAVTGVIVGLAIISIAVRGLNFGIEFTGGTEFRVPVTSVSQTEADRLGDVVADAGVEGAESPTVTTAAGNEGGSVLIQVEELAGQGDTDTLAQALADAVGVKVDQVTVSEIGASWGNSVAKRAALGVAVFLVLVLLFIGAYFREWKMSIAAFVALVHDVVITVGVYALSGFPVTPAAVTGLLAILGFSLYDTVVVFDKVRENTMKLRQTKQTYAVAANLAVNQTLVRSINTGIVALIPIGAILYVSATQLGASSLQDLALAQFVGMLVGVYSSIVLAPRVLVHIKSNETEVVLAEKRAKARARAQADRYAAVPNFTEDMPVRDEDDDDEPVVVSDDEVTLAKPRTTEAMGRGRTVPPARGPVAQSYSAGRVQPSRQTKSKREKK